MKKSKKFLKVLSATAIAAIMATTMASTAAFATDPEYTVTVNAGTVTGTYDVYKVASVTPNGNAYDYAWAVGDSTGLPDINAGGVTSSNAQDTANSLARKVTDTEKFKSNIALGTGVDLPDGYYLIMVHPTNAGIMAQPGLVVVTGGATTTDTLDTKTSPLTLNKTITKVTKTAADTTNIGKVSDSGESAVGAVGNYVEYNIEATVPDYDDNVSELETSFSITDDPSDGLVYSSADANVVVTNVNDTATLTDGTEYDLTSEGDGFKITFKDSYTLDNGGDTVNITFKLKIDTDATTGTIANGNTATSAYSNEYATGKGSAGTDSDDANLYTAKFTVYKTDDSELKNPLTGAGFTLSSEVLGYSKEINSTEETPISTFEFTGLSEGTYTLEETKLPGANYKKAPNKTITITAGKDNGEYNGTFTYGADASTDNISIENTEGSTLPGTGGVGTTMFTIGGIALVVVAGAMLTIYMKKRKTSEEE